MKSCLGILAAMIGLFTVFVSILYLSTFDFLAKPEITVKNGYTKMTFEDVRIEPKGIVSQAAEGIKSFEYLRLCPIAYRNNDGQYKYRMRWTVHCCTSAKVTRSVGQSATIIDNHTQKIHILAGSHVGLLLGNGQEIICTLPDSACYDGVVGTSRSATYAQQYTFYTDYSEDDMCIITKDRVKCVWFETNEGRIEINLSNVRSKELMKKFKKMYSFIYAEN